MDLCRGTALLTTRPERPPTPSPGSLPGGSPTALSFVTRHVSGPSCTSFFLVMSRFWRREGVTVSAVQGRVGRVGGDDGGLGTSQGSGRCWGNGEGPWDR